MADETYQLPVVTLADGRTLELTAIIRGTVTPPPPPDPIPDPPPVPAPVPNVIRVGGAEYPFAGINPTAASNPSGAAFPPAYRGTDQLVAYQQPLTASPANQYGAEVSVLAGAIVGPVNDRLATSDTRGTQIPAGGGILSGHGKARAFLLANAKPGATVELAYVEPRPTPPGPPAPVSGRTVAVYLMRGQGKSTQIPAGVNQMRVAFAQGTPPRLVEWGGESTAQLAAGLTAFRARGGTVLLSIGGAGGAVSTSDHVGFIDAVHAIEQQIPLDGIDWDIEASALNVADVVAISSALAAGRRDTWVTSFVPSGGPPVAVYLAAAVACHRASLRVLFGQQLYDAVVDQATAIRQTEIAIAAGLPPECVLIGMMCPSPSEGAGQAAKRWTVSQCESNLRAIQARWPSIGGAYLWESARPGTTEWATRIAAVLA